MSLNHTQPKGLRLSNMMPKGNDYYKSHYNQDGTGRDSYIFLNNGGITHKFNTPSKQITRTMGGGGQVYVGNDQGGPRTNLNPECAPKYASYE